MKTVRSGTKYIAVMLAVTGAALNANAQVALHTENGGSTPQWQSAGWGGGGYYWATAFHPAKDGVIYMAGDVLGVYKSLDHGRSWRIINNGLRSYAIYSLAVDRSNPDTVYAALGGWAI